MPMFMALPEGQQVELKFYFPDGVEVSKVFRTNQLLQSRPVFVYDPLARDVLADTSRSGRREGGGRGGRDGGRGRDRGNQNQDGSGSQPGGAPAPAAAPASGQ